MACLLERLSGFLNNGLLGQKEAVREFSTTVALALSGRPRPERTKGLIFLAGPTGTGKTEMVRLTSQFLYGAAVDQHFHRFDMAEYQHPDSLHRLLGAPGQPALLGQAIDRLNEAAGANGTAFLLFDEIEKAYADLVTILLSFDAARSTMSDGVTRDLTRIFVVITSNVGSARAADLQHAPYSALRDEVLVQAEKRFRKETLARFDARIVMNRLDYEVQREITRRLLEKEVRVQSDYLVRPIKASPEVLNFLIREGFTPDLGARNLRSTVERQVGCALLPWTSDYSDDPASDRLSRTLLLREDRANRQLIATPLCFPMSAPVATKPFIHVEILDFSKDPTLIRETADYYCSLDPERRSWPEEKRLRLAVRTECKWGRVPVGDQVYMLSEFGEGPREPLSKNKHALVKFYAELRPSAPGANDGYIEPTAFCQVQFDDEGCKSLRAQGLVQLEEFMRRTVPECAKAFEEWQSLLLTAKARYAEIKARVQKTEAALAAH
jgi:hypothetical protein